MGIVGQSLHIDEALATRAFKKPLPTHKAGHPVEYSDALILLMLTIAELFHLRLRQTEGFMADFLPSMGIYWQLPDYTTLSRRAKKLKVQLLPYGHYLGSSEPLHLCIDSSGFKIYGEGEWKVRKHGADKRRSWRESHIALDYSTRDIVALRNTADHVHDNTQLLPLLADTERNLNKAGSKRTLSSVIGDGAYDSNENYHHADNLGAIFISPPKKHAEVHARMRKHRIYEDEQWLARNFVVKRCMAIGQEEWKKEVGYHRRSLVENAFYRLKTIFGERLSMRTEANQYTEQCIRARLINKFNTYGLPKYAIVAN